MPNLFNAQKLFLNNDEASAVYLGSTQVWSSTPPFSPLDLSPALWLDAADTTTITASSGAVSQWNNKGSLSNFTQSSSTVQPTTAASTLNGLNVIDFASDYLTTATQSDWTFLHNGTDLLIATVWKPGASSTPGVPYGLLGSSRGGTNVRGLSIYYDDRSGLDGGLATGPNALWVRSGAGFPGFAEIIRARAGSFFVPNAFQVFTATTDPTNATAANRLKAFAGSGSAVTPNDRTGTPSTSGPNDPLQVGAVGNNVHPLTGSIAEIVIVSGANATEANRVLLRDYLATKWGL